VRFAGFRRPKRDTQSPPGPHILPLPLPLVCWPERLRLHSAHLFCQSTLPFSALAQHARRRGKDFVPFNSTPHQQPSSALPSRRPSLVGTSRPSAVASARRAARGRPRWRRCPFLSSRRRGRPRAARPPTTGAASTSRRRGSSSSPLAVSSG
jgi:hypothetical protein